MPQEKDDVARRIRKVLALERIRGYADDAVTCGLSEFIRRHLPAVFHLVADYPGAPRLERQKAVSRLLAYLDDLENENALTGQAVSQRELERPVRYAKGVGNKRGKILEQLGITTIEQLLTYLPRRLEDRSQFDQIGRLKPGESVSVRAEVLAVDQIRVHRRMTVIKATLSDGTGFLHAVWFNQPWIARQLGKGETIDLHGKVEQNYGEWQMQSPIWEPAGEGIVTGRLVPIYSATEGISSRLLCSLIARNLDLYENAFHDPLPASLRKRHQLPLKRAAVRTLHFPPDRDAFDRARRRLAFEELFLLQIGLAQTVQLKSGASHADSDRVANTFLANLPFTLTESQQTALREIVSDLRAPTRMARLLQGDVGSGKTLVALTAALHAIDAGHQVAFMVPTEILAEQHAKHFQHLLKALPVETALLTGGEKTKDDMKKRLADGKIDLLVGTHALIQEDVTFAALGFVVIDEQQRFGVVQRSLIEEKGDDADLLIMSATPIPRTIILTLYGEFTVSLIDEMPKGERKIQSVWIAETRRSEAYTEIRRLLDQGGKGYVVLPLIETSEHLDVKAAAAVAEELSTDFPDVGVGLVHGRLSAEERRRVMEAFRSDEIRLLVATTVIEVGIDVLDANFMVIENADRFGLAQLHQLRGRIGRSGQPAMCFAIATASTEEAKQRLEAFSTHPDGFSIAEEDLRIRGPGDLFGTQQHGFLNGLPTVDLIHDLDLMEEARREAQQLLEEGTSDALIEEVDRRFGELLQWLRV